MSVMGDNYGLVDAPVDMSNSSAIHDRVFALLVGLHADRPGVHAKHLADLIRNPSPTSLATPSGLVTTIQTPEGRFQKVCELLKGGTPPQLILGFTTILGRTIAVNENVLAPTQEAELFGTAIIEVIRRRGLESGALLDLGCGSGVLSICMATEFSNATIYASDISHDAVAMTSLNAEISSARNLTVVQGDLFESVRTMGLKRQFNLVASNPPYVTRPGISLLSPYLQVVAPRTAIDGGPDGLSVIRRIISEVPDVLADGGLILIKHDDGQHDSVAALIEASSRLHLLPLEFDKFSTERVILAQLSAHHTGRHSG